MTRKKTKKKAEVDLKGALVTMIKANIIAYVVTAIFVLLGSIILTYTDASSQVEDWIIKIGIVVAAFFAGFDTAKVDTRDGYKWGAIGGSLYFIIFMAINSQLNAMAIGAVFTLAILVIISSTIAGIISVNCKE